MERLRDCHQRGIGAACGERQDELPLIVSGGRGWHLRGGRWRGLQYGVRIGAAEAKGIDAGQQSVLRILFQWRGFDGPLQVQALKVERRVWRVEMQVWRHHSVLEAEGHFDKTRDSRAGFQMADVRFH